MAPGGPPGAGRGRGGKFKKFTRGGGKHFSRNLRPLDVDGNEIVERDPNATSSEEEEEEEDDDDSEEDSSEEDGTAKAALTREERRAAAKAKKEAAIAKKKGVPQPGDMPSSSSSEEESDDDMPANPNHSKAARKQATAVPAALVEATEGVKDMSVAGKSKSKPVEQLSRREREAVQAQQAKERYQKLHEAGKTDEAKADLARLRLIKEKREAEAARKQAEKEEREELEKGKKADIEAREAKRREAAMGVGSKGKGKGKK